MKLWNVGLAALIILLLLSQVSLAQESSVEAPQPLRDLRGRSLKLTLGSDLRIPALTGLDVFMGHVVAYEKGETKGRFTADGCEVFFHSGEHFERTLPKGSVLDVSTVAVLDRRDEDDEDLVSKAILFQTPNHPEIYQIICSEEAGLFTDPKEVTLTTVERALGMKMDIETQNLPLALDPPQTSCLNMMEGLGLPVEPCTKKQALRLLPTQDCVTAFDLMKFPQMGLAVKYCQSPALWHPQIQACALWKAREALMREESPARAIDGCRKGVVN